MPPEETHGIEPRLAHILARWWPPSRPESALSTLRGRVGLTAAWCADQLVPGSESDVLRPDRIYSAPVLLGARSWTVEDVVKKRAEDWRPPTVPKSRDGRILCHVPDATLSGGTAGTASDGFFDAQDIPPWGTWLAYLEDAEIEECLGSRANGLLLAWVPSALVPAATRGVRVSSGGSLTWLSDAAAPLNELEDRLRPAASNLVSGAGSARPSSTPDWLRRVPLFDLERGV